MKKLLLASALALGILNTPTQASLIGKRSEKELNHEFPQMSVDLPHDVVRQIVLEGPEILPAAILVCKDWFETTKDLASSTTIFFKQPFSSSAPYTDYVASTYFCTFADKDKHGQQKLRLMFNQMFRFVVFKIEGSGIKKIKGEETLDTVSLQTYKEIRRRLTGDADFPQNLKAAYTDKFAPLGLTSTVQFNYLTLFNFYKTRNEISCGFLSACHTVFDSLSTLLTTPDVNSYEKVKKSISTLKVDSINYERFHPLMKTLFHFFKLVVIKTDNDQRYLSSPSSYVDLQEFQTIPVNFETLDKDIETLKTKAETQLLALATQRWEILEKIKTMLRVG